MKILNLSKVRWWMSRRCISLIFVISVAIFGPLQAQQDHQLNITDIADLSLLSNETEQNLLQYYLPSFSLTLKVTKTDNELIRFQDTLQETIRKHLETFFFDKIIKTGVVGPFSIAVDLDSKLLWRELSSVIDHSEYNNPVHQYESSSQILSKDYEVHGSYDCLLHLNFEEEPEKETFVTQSLMSLFFIEAFQAQNYWDLLHMFLESSILQSVSDVQITVLEDGFVPYTGGNPSFNDDLYIPTRVNPSSKSIPMTPGMIMGVAFATLFCIGLIGIWMYLCFMVPGIFLDSSEGKRQQEKSYVDGSVTDDACTNESIGFDSDQESAWMDAWAHSVTSIPLRHPQSFHRKKRHGQPIKQSFLRPAHEHSSFLDCIEEADNESCASTVASSRTCESKEKGQTLRISLSEKYHTALKFQLNHFETVEENTAENVTMSR